MAITKLVSDSLGAGVGGKILQVVSNTNNSYSSSSSTVPADNSIPQNTEGFEVVTVSITPSSASNKLLIILNSFATSSGSGSILCTSLFQDTTASALKSVAVTAGAGGWMVHNSFNHYMTAGTTSATTFKMRLGGHIGTTYINGNTGARLYNGKSNCSITVMEIQA